jgi:hypothetical protein
LDTDDVCWPNRLATSVHHVLHHLQGRTEEMKPCPDCLVINGKAYCDMNCGPAICSKCKANITEGEKCTCPKEIRKK